MKKLCAAFLWLMSVMTVFTVATYAADSSKAAPVAEAKMLKPQTACPVMGGKIDSAFYTDIQGQRVYHCCGGCSKALKADPDKYFKKAAEQGILFENIQKTCPVSGDTLKTKIIFSDYQGRRIFFCCADCVKKFAEDPVGALAKMDKPLDSKAATESMHH